MIVYALCTEMTGKTLTLWSIGEKNRVPETVKESYNVTTYYSDINEAKRAYRMSKEQLLDDGYTCVDNT